jgi:hypothetical protein
VGVDERALGKDGLGGRVRGGARALHVLVLNERTPLRIAAVAFGALVRGLDGFVESDAVSSHLVTRASAKLRRRTGTVAVDGELVRVTSPLHYELRKDAVLMVRGRDVAGVIPDATR